MKKGIANFIGRLSSRKFLLAVAAALTFYANKQYMELAVTVITYLAAEGSADIMTEYAKNKYAEPAKLEQTTALIQSGDLEVDDKPKNIVPGFTQP